MTSIIGDGVREDIFYLLWKKESPFNESLSINIPDTVIFRKGSPSQWYFTTEQGVLLRKKKNNLTMENIIQGFTQKAKRDDIVAYFVAMDEREYSDIILKKHNRGNSLDSKTLLKQE